MIAALIFYLLTSLILFSATVFALGFYVKGWGVILALGIFAANVWSAATFWTAIEERGKPNGIVQRNDGAEG